MTITVLTKKCIFSIKAPTPVTTMKISSKRVSVSVQQIFLTFADMKRKEATFQRKEMNHNS